MSEPLTSETVVRVRDLPSWQSDKNDGARQAFLGVMQGRRLGYVATRIAWEWFLIGFRKGGAA